MSLKHFEMNADLVFLKPKINQSINLNFQRNSVVTNLPMMDQTNLGVCVSHTSAPGDGPVLNPVHHYAYSYLSMSYHLDDLLCL